MDRASFLARFDQEWNAFEESYAGLPEAEMARPGVAGEWSVRDLIGHVATWDAEGAKAAALMVKGRRQPKYSDSYNDEQVVAKRSLSLRALKKDAKDSHQTVASLIQTIPARYFARETAVRRLLRGETYKHYTEHAASIQAWRQRRGV
jgi:hypothetical protein